MPVLPRPTHRTATRHAPADDLRSLLAWWAPLLDDVQTNVFIADNDLRIVHANRRAQTTLRQIDASLRDAFGVTAADIVGGSIHRFHRAPEHVERVLRDNELPRQARFTFGDTTLDTRIARLHTPSGTAIGYIVNWEDATEATSARRDLEELHTHLDSAASAIEEVSSSVAEIAHSTEEAASVARDGVTSVDTVAESAGALREASDEISRVTEAISEIAAQTNLLALNATIEAARAGEAGKGFAVVASEVKDLAQRTQEATGDVTARIDGVQQRIAEVVNAIDAVRATIATVDEHVTSIAGAVEQQRAASDHLARDIGEAASNARDVARQAGG